MSGEGTRARGGQGGEVIGGLVFLGLRSRLRNGVGGRHGELAWVERADFCTGRGDRGLGVAGLGLRLGATLLAVLAQAVMVVVIVSVARALARAIAIAAVVDVAMAGTMTTLGLGSRRDRHEDAKEAGDLGDTGGDFFRGHVGAAVLEVADVLDGVTLGRGKVVTLNTRLEGVEADAAFASSRLVELLVVGNPLGRVETRDADRNVVLTFARGLGIGSRDAGLAFLDSDVSRHTGSIENAGELDIAAADSPLVHPAVLKLTNEDPAEVEDALASHTHGQRVRLLEGPERAWCQVLGRRRERARSDHVVGPVATLVRDILVEAHPERPDCVWCFPC